MSGGDTPQQAPPPPPPPPSGSPFGRFLTAPVLMATALALVVSAVAIQFIPGGGGGPGGAAPAPTGISGSWSGGVTTIGEREGTVSLELHDDGTGFMTRGRCTGALKLVRGGAEMAIFVYTDTSRRRGCPRRTGVRVRLLDEDTLRFVQRRGDRTLASGTLARG